MNRLIVLLLAAVAAILAPTAQAAASHPLIHNHMCRIDTKVYGYAAKYGSNRVPMRPTPCNDGATVRTFNNDDFLYHVDEYGTWEKVGCNGFEYTKVMYYGPGCRRVYGWVSSEALVCEDADERWPIAVDPDCRGLGY